MATVSKEVEHGISQVTDAKKRYSAVAARSTAARGPAAR